MQTAVQLQLLRDVAAGSLPFNPELFLLSLAGEVWEVRMTALLAACRHGLREPASLRGLEKAVKSAALPQTSRSGLDEADRGLMRLFKQAVLALLGGQPVPPDPEGPPLKGQALMNHISRCIAGEPTRWYDYIWWWVFTLTTPLTAAPPPEPLPDGIVADQDGRLRLALTEIEVVWVAAGDYWLGDGRPQGPENGPPIPLRLVRQPQGFFVARLPVAPDYSQPQTPQLLPWIEVEELVGKIGRIEQLAVRLPTADEWEVAARGSDGRRFPWGNGYWDGMLAQPAPSGALLMAGVAPQWTRTAASAEEKLICGHTDNLHASLRRPLDLITGKAAFRPVISGNFPKNPSD